MTNRAEYLKFKVRGPMEGGGGPKMEEVIQLSREDLEL